MNAPVSHRELWRSRLELPNYEVREAARYANVHSQTVSRWHQNTTLGSREARSKLSYLQLIELAVVAACKAAGMKLADIRAARSYFAGAFRTEHPFATLKLQTDGIDLAAKAGADLLIGNKRGQLAWNEIIGGRFEEFEYEDGLASRWHVAGLGSPVLIDPRVRFGAPHVAGVPTWLMRDRWAAGEPMDEITDDLSLAAAQVLAGLTFEGIDPSKPRKNEWRS
jgi:uncharacterized protein (DUF433 family)